MLSKDALKEIRDYRHRMRSMGRWGACFEVSSFVEHRFDLRRREGVYQCTDGVPIFKHCWNETKDGGLLDATADQFLEGEDIALLPPRSGEIERYRDIYTVAHNPGVTPWLSGRAWVGEPDEQYWRRRYDSRELGPGWWLSDNRAYLEWLAAGALAYPLFAAKRDEYRALGYGVD